jgi:hypothetical protein
MSAVASAFFTGFTRFGVAGNTHHALSMIS